MKLRRRRPNKDLRIHRLEVKIQGLVLQVKDLRELREKDREEYLARFQRDETECLEARLHN